MSFISDLYENRLKAYAYAPNDIKEHYLIEQTVLAGGYGYRQIMELVQNGADAILEECEQQPDRVSQTDSKILVAINNDKLYVANTGASLSEDGVTALLQSHSSSKRGNQIGRFGIGFKSLLRMGGKIDILSRERSMRFDPSKAKDVIRNEFKLGADSNVPALRLAWDLDRDGESQNDPFLNQLEWATTVVRAEIINSSMLAHIKEEMVKFPTAFLLFLPVPVRITMDFGDGESTELSRRNDGRDMILAHGQETSRWRVIERIIQLTDEDKAAKNDATEIHGRSEVPIAWAIPLDINREEAGRFWAFFPTETPTRLPGILNAPWKLNSDRKSVIEGEWNQFLMLKAAVMICEELPHLASTEDPGKPLDAFPRRMEKQDELAKTLVEEVWKKLTTQNIIPDGTGALRQAMDLQRPPVIDTLLLEAWSNLASDHARRQYVHPTALSGYRNARLEELSSRLSVTSESHPCLKKVDAVSWMKVIAKADLDTSCKLLQMVADYSKLNRVSQEQWRKERPLFEVVLNRNGSLSTVQRAIIAPIGIDSPGHDSIDDRLIADENSHRILTSVLEVKILNDAEWNRILHESLNNTNTKSWYYGLSICPYLSLVLWKRLLAAPAELAIKFIQDNTYKLPIKRKDGEWRMAGSIIKPGEIVAADDEENRGVLVDEVFSVQNSALLSQMPIGSFPSGKQGPMKFDQLYYHETKWLDAWLSEKRAQYQNQLPAGKNPQSGYLQPISFMMPFGWTLLFELKDRSHARATSKLLDIASRNTEHYAMVQFGHTTQSHKYSPIQVKHPLPWIICHHGTIEICSQQIEVATLLEKIDEPLLDRIPGWDNIKTKLKTVSNGVSTNHDPEDVEKFWNALIDGLISTKTIGELWTRELWDKMNEDGWLPDNLPSGDEKIPLDDVYFTTSHDLAQHGLRAGLVVALVSTSTGEEWQNHGAKRLDDSFTLSWDDSTTQDSHLTDALPELSQVLNEEIGKRALCRLVSGLKTRFNGTQSDIGCIIWQDVLHLDSQKIISMPRVDQFNLILSELDHAGWLKMPHNQALNLIANSQVAARREQVAGGHDLPEKLLLAVGNRPTPLLAVLGNSVSNVIPSDAPPRQLAELALALHGPVILFRLLEHLKNEGLAPPTRWGTSEARSFVDALGFPEEFAASGDSRREAELLVSGPIHLPELHDFQKEVVAGLDELIKSEKSRKRAVVNLPTGGGKTRATVQAAVQIILAPPSDRRSVLWIAQTDELCEQAVQAFRQVWANVGANSTDLRIVRLWSGHRNPSRSADELPVVVVASIQTLNSRLGQEELAWLAEPGLVVIDECHHAITKSYTGVLRWLDADAPQGSKNSRNEPPVIGLSATPFRNSRDDVESQRLAKRFDHFWLPANQKSLYSNLINNGFLARADPQPLYTDLPIPDELLEGLDNPDLTSIQIENIMERINQSLAIDKSRNDLLIQTIKDSNAESILCFANSVSHAEELTARLCMQGITAAAVSGQTPASARRYFLSRFQSGDVRVLCNYAVLSTGFDAPKTDMLLISRQVLSPVLYMQMVGRGLRGPRNGGTAGCKIVTVMDNLGRFNEKHPYHYCAKFYNGSSSS